MEKKQTTESAGTKHADERTQRRSAEAEGGGTSSQESAERYASGENPGGTHGGGGTQGAQGAQGESKPNPYEDIGVKKGRG